MTDSFSTRASLQVGGRHFHYRSLKRLEERFRASRLPYSLRVLLENLLRHEDGVNVTAADIEAVLDWNPKVPSTKEIAFMPARVVMQDFTGVPCVVDLAAMRDAMQALGGDPKKINPLIPAELVIDHSVQVDHFGSADAVDLNARIEFQRNQERYEFLRWGQKAFNNFKVVPPRTGIVHQVNLEHLARVAFVREERGQMHVYPDTVVGTDSHTTMINGLGVLGWGVGGIEAEAAMLGQPSTMLIPEVIGFKLYGKLPEGSTATDLVLTVTQMLRKRGVVEKFVEFYGEGLNDLPLADRATIANMAPEYGATCGFFPVDGETLNYLRLSGRTEEQIALVEAYYRAQGLFREAGAPDCDYTDVLELNLADVKPSLAGPKRPQDRVLLENVKQNYRDALAPMAETRAAKGKSATPGSATVTRGGETFTLVDGAVAIAAITSCTNTSNPSVMLGAGLVAKKALDKGLKVKPWVKTSLAPGSQVVTDYLKAAGLLDALEATGFSVVGYGCTTCIGNSGPLPPEISQGISEGDLVAASVLSGNRNFEGRVHAEIKMNYLASPLLVVAYAIAGTVDIDLTSEPIGIGSDGQPVFLKDIWPSNHEIAETVRTSISNDMYRRSYANVFKGDERWQQIAVTGGDQYGWNAQSTYIANPPYFTGMTLSTAAVNDVKGARALALLGDSITTDHISPAGDFKPTTPAGKFLTDRGVQYADFNSYGSRRGNHDIMMRGTFANIRLKNQLAPGTEGGFTTHFPTGEVTSIYEASMRYQSAGTALVVLAGKEYGTGSSRDWAAKGTMLLGVKVVIAESFERIHRSNLVGMGVLPCRFMEGESAASLGLSGRETFDFDGLGDGTGKTLTVTATAEDGSVKTFQVRALLETPKEVEYYRHGGILQYVLRQLAGNPGGAGKGQPPAKKAA
jgi:aconitate hydratase